MIPPWQEFYPGAVLVIPSGRHHFSGGPRAEMKGEALHLPRCGLRWTSPSTRWPRREAYKFQAAGATPLMDVSRRYIELEALLGKRRAPARRPGPDDARVSFVKETRRGFPLARRAIAGLRCVHHTSATVTTKAASSARVHLGRWHRKLGQLYRRARFAEMNGRSSTRFDPARPAGAQPLDRLGSRQDGQGRGRQASKPRVQRGRRRDLPSPGMCSAAGIELAKPLLTGDDATPNKAETRAAAAWTLDQKRAHLLHPSCPL